MPADPSDDLQQKVTTVSIPETLSAISHDCGGAGLIFRPRASDERRQRYVGGLCLRRTPDRTQETVERVVDITERLINFREERLAQGITLGQQYDSLNDPGRNPLRILQAELDAAVADVYGFDSDEGPLAQLLALNESIAAEEHEGLIEPRGPGNAGLIGTKRTTNMIEPALRLI
jgi:hypothetical protein